MCCCSIVFLLHAKFNESAFLLRERESHLRECEELDKAELNWEKTSKELGINYRSILFELQHFDVDILLPDVMHDLLEGTLQYETKLILQHVIRQKFISYALFTKTLDGLELGYMEADNKPSEMALASINSSDQSLGQKGMFIF